MKNIIICIFGRKGSGKTTYVLNYIKRFKRVIIIDSLEEYNFFAVYSILDLIKFLKANLNNEYYRVSYRPRDENDALFFETVYSLYNVTCIAEEADKYCSPHSIDIYFEKILKYGRHKSINVIAVSRRPAEISKTLTSQADGILTFNQNQKIETDFFGYYMENPEVLNQLKVGESRVILGPEFFAAS